MNQLRKEEELKFKTPDSSRYQNQSICQSICALTVNNVDKIFFISIFLFVRHHIFNGKQPPQFSLKKRGSDYKLQNYKNKVKIENVSLSLKKEIMYRLWIWTYGILALFEISWWNLTAMIALVFYVVGSFSAMQNLSTSQSSCGIYSLHRIE